MGNKDNVLIESIRNGDANLAIKLLSKNRKTSKKSSLFYCCCSCKI
jgi:hypothetical protein